MVRAIVAVGLGCSSPSRMTAMRWIVACLVLMSVVACGPIVDYHPPELDPATNVIHDGHSCNG